MAHGQRESALITLVNQLDALDARRRVLVAQIQAAAGRLGPGDGSAASGSGAASKGGRRPGFRLSPEARAKIAAAQRARWAKHRAKKG